MNLSDEEFLENILDKKKKKKKRKKVFRCYVIQGLVVINFLACSDRTAKIMYVIKVT